MTPRKETEPTKEHWEVARKLFVHEGCPWADKDNHYCRKCEDVASAAVLLARRDEARDAEVARPWREALLFARVWMGEKPKPCGKDCDGGCTTPKNLADCKAHVDALLSQPAAEEGRP